MNEEIEKARINEKQMNLFFSAPREVCERIGLNWLATRRLYEEGFLSFDPAVVEKLNGGQEAELVFLGQLVVAGCDSALLESLLSPLKRPYQYRPDHVYYHWPSREWRLLPQKEPIHEESVFEDWLYQLTRQGDREKLEQIKSETEEALAKLKEYERRARHKWNPSD